jgi:hypothetical protein
MIKHYSSKRAIIDILSIKEQVIRAFKDEIKYKPFLDFIFAKDYLNDEDIELPSMKLISESISIKYSELSKLIKELYFRLFDDEVLNFKFDFSEVEIVFFINYLKKSIQFKCERLKYLPRVGEQIDISFIQANLGNWMYYVNKVEHKFEGQKQVVYITLRSGIYNSHLKQCIEQAYLRGEISDKEYFTLEDYEFEDKLYRRF